MKNSIKLFLLMLVIGICTPVYAMQHIPKEIIPVGETATVPTEMFTFNNFHYESKVAGKKYGRFVFETITNKTKKKVPISISLLLFDSDRKNIGFVPYCTGQDVGGDFAQLEIKGNKSISSFYIDITSRYFIDGYGPTDVAYFAVYDENPYCHIGGYDKYAGLTIEEIANGKIGVEDDKNPFLALRDFFLQFNILSMIRTVFFAIVTAIIEGLVYNILYKKMFNKSTLISYFPITCNYVGAKLAFGERIAKIYLIALIASIALCLVKFLRFIYAILNFGGYVIFFINGYKLITKKYDFCYQEPYVPPEIVEPPIETAVNGGVTDGNSTDIPTDNPSVDTNVEKDFLTKFFEKLFGKSDDSDDEYDVSKLIEEEKSRKEAAMQVAQTEQNEVKQEESLIPKEIMVEVPVSVPVSEEKADVSVSEEKVEEKPIQEEKQNSFNDPTGRFIETYISDNSDNYGSNSSDSENFHDIFSPVEDYRVTSTNPVPVSEPEVESNPAPTSDPVVENNKESVPVTTPEEEESELMSLFK